MSNSKWCLPEPCYAPTPQPKALSSPYCYQTPQTALQKERIINGRVRMDESLYTMKYATYPIQLNIRQYPWNNQSDQLIASKQEPYKSETLRIASGRPGALTPGGIGTDVKHGSYSRYLNKLKGKKQGCIKCPGL